MSTQIVSQTAQLRILGTPLPPVGSDPLWIPVKHVNRGAHCARHLTQEQLETALLWMERTAYDPRQPRKIADVFPVGEVGAYRYRDAAVKLAEMYVLLKCDRKGYVLSKASRPHLEYWQQRQNGNGTGVRR